MNFKRLSTNAACLLTSAFLLAACASTPEPIQVDAKPVERAPLVLPDVDQIQTRSVDWIVYSRKAAPGEPGSIEYINQKLSEADSDSAFVLTATQYENLSLNTAAGRQLIIQLQAQLNAYKRYYQDQQSLIDQYNSAN